MITDTRCPAEEVCQVNVRVKPEYVSPSKLYLYPESYAQWEALSKAFKGNISIVVMYTMVNQ